jgi:hypothetical protein
LIRWIRVSAETLSTVWKKKLFERFLAADLRQVWRHLLAIDSCKTGQFADKRFLTGKPQKQFIWHAFAGRRSAGIIPVLMKTFDNSCAIEFPLPHTSIAVPDTVPRRA